MKFSTTLFLTLLLTGRLFAGLLPGNDGGGNVLPGSGGSGGNVLPGGSGSGGNTLPGGGNNGGNVLPSSPPESGGSDFFVSATRLKGILDETTNTIIASDTGNNVESTKEVGEPIHGGYEGNPGGKSQWWSWTATVDGLMTITTEGSTFDTVVSVYSGGPVSALIALGSDDNSGPGQTSTVSVHVELGVKYYIAVDGFNGASGDINLSMVVAPTAISGDDRPINDDFANRKILYGNSVTDYGSNVNATLEENDPDPFVVGTIDNYVGQNVWWSWTAPSDGTVVIDTEGSNYDSTLAVYRGDELSSLSFITQDDDSGEGRSSKVTLRVLAGATYQIAVDGYSSTDGLRFTGDITLNINFAPYTGQPANDTFDFRIGVQGSDYVLNTTVTRAFNFEANEPVPATANADNTVWWTWTAPAEAGTLTITAKARGVSVITPNIAIFKGNSIDSLVPVAELTDVNHDGTTELKIVVEGGQTYQIAVADEVRVVSILPTVYEDCSFTFSLSYVSGRPAFDEILKNQLVAPGEIATFSVVPTETTLSPISYQWQRKVGNVWSNFLDGGVYSGAITDTLEIDPASLAMNGQMFRCVLTNVAGSATSAEVALLIVPAAPTVIPGSGSVTIKRGEIYSQSVSRSNDSVYTSILYYAQGLPAGLKINASNGLISGTVTAAPGSYTVTYWTQSGKLKSVIRTVVMIVPPFPVELTGNFEALILDNPDPMTGMPIGKLEVTVGSTGAFSGKFTSSAATANTFKGSMLLSADYTNATASVAIVRKGFPKAQINFTLTKSGSPLGATTDVDASLKAGATTLGTAVSGIKVSTSLVPWADTYTMVLGDLTDLSAPPPKPLPGGSGYASVNVGATGVMTIAGRNADGTPLTASLAPASYDTYGTYRLYAKPTATLGSYVAGWLKLTQSVLQAPAYEGTISNNQDLYWQVGASKKSATYPAGFGPVGLSARIDSWDTLLVPGDLNLNSISGFFDVEIDGGGITNVGSNINNLPEVLRLLNGGQISLTDQNYTSWSISVNPATGIFTGSFTLTQPITRKVTFGGALSQLHTTDASPFGQGYFLLPSTVKKGPVVSGSIQFLKP
jgi:hypothetical protein